MGRTTCTYLLNVCLATTNGGPIGVAEPTTPIVRSQELDAIPGEPVLSNKLLIPPLLNRISPGQVLLDMTAQTISETFSHFGEKSGDCRRCELLAGCSLCVYNQRNRSSNDHRYMLN